MNVNDWYNGKYYFLKLSTLSFDELMILWKFTRAIDETYGWRYWTLANDEVRFSEKLFYECLDLKLEFMKIIGIIEARIDKQQFKKIVEDNMLQKQKPYYDGIEF